MALALLLVVVGCHRGGTHTRAADSAVWTDASAPPLTIADLARLESGGIAELFVEAAKLDWQGGQPQLAPLQLPRLPRRGRATLVVRGNWPLALGDADAAARALATALESVSRRAEDAGFAVAGWHLDLVGLPGKDGGKLAHALRRRLEPAVLLSATLPRDALAAEGIDEVTDATDFVVSFLYGVREGEADDPAAWDFQRVHAATKQLEELDEPYLVGVVVRGVATLVRAGGEASELTGTSLADLAWNRQLRLRHGFSLEGVDRQVYAFTADYPTRVGETRLAAGDDVRVVGTSTGHVQELRKQIGSWHLEHCLGELFYRLPHPGEAFTLGADNLAAATGEVPAMPRPRVLVPKLASSPGRVTVTVVLENPSSEGSDIGQVDSNYIELWAVGGAFGDVRPGQFFRYDLLAPGPGGKLVRARVPTVLRFFVPVLRAGARIESGPIEVRTVREGLRDLQVRASFLASYGGTADIPTTSWEVLQPPPPPTPPPTPTPTPRSRRK